MIAEWGKRYLQPIAEWFGMEFPDTITNVSPFPLPDHADIVISQDSSSSIILSVVLPSLLWPTWAIMRGVDID
jgi:hypothetical protein